MRAFLTTVLALTLAACLYAQKKRVAVMDFDNSGVPQNNSAGPLAGFFSAPNVGKAAADLLLNSLVQRGSVVVIERAAIDKLLAEQNLTNSNRSDPQTAARIGRILGVDAIILGSISKYNYEDKTTGGSRGGFGGIGGGSMTTKHDFKALVQITARIVSPDTAEVLFVSQGTGEVIKKDVKVDMRDQNAGMAMITGNVNNPIMTEALDKAIAPLANQLEQSIAKLPARAPVIDGLVADAQDSGRLILNVGSQNGVKVGDRLQISRAGKEIRDPSTGKLLLRDDTQLGEAVVNTVNENFSVATFEGKEAVKTGDLAKSIPKK